MARVTNNGKRAIGLSRGLVIEPSQTLEVPHWESVKGRANVVYFLESGILTAEVEVKPARVKKAEEPKAETEVNEG